jgi:hypothetical protein
MNIRKSIAAAALALVSFGALAASGDADFTLTNRTGLTIAELYVSPANRAQWGRDRLGDGTLDNGKSRHFKIGQTASCQQDIKVTFENADGEATWENVDLCAIEKITLRYNRQTKQVSADAE